MTVTTKTKSNYRFSDHPWVSYFYQSVLLILAILITATISSSLGVPQDAPWRHLIIPTIPHLLILFVIAPYVLKIPNEGRSFAQYLRDIRLTNIQPLFPLLLMGISCTLTMLLSIFGTSILYRISLGGSLNGVFLRNLVQKLNRDLPPYSMGYIVAFPSIFEEVGRGIWLVLFHKKYSEKMTILITGLSFGLFHFVNLIGGGDPVFVIRQVIFGCFVGLFYGFMVLRVNSLLPAMIFHYLVNMMMGSCGWYLSHRGSALDQVLFGALNVVVVTPILILWVKLFAERWVSPLSNPKRHLPGNQPAEI
jgi:membrane protease YdiL (CAAX protease family)